MRSSEETLNLITELVKDKGGEFYLWFDDERKQFIARIDFEGGSGSYAGYNIICARAVNEMLDKVLEKEK